MIEVIVYFISIILMQISILYLYGKLVGKPLVIKIKYMLLFAVIGILQIILNLYFVSISSLFTIIYSYFLFKKIYSSNNDEAKNYSIIIWIICLIIDIFLMVLSASLGLMKFYELDVKLYKSIASILLSAIIFILSKFKYLIKKLRKIYQKMRKINVTINQILVIATVFMALAVTSSNFLFNQFMVSILFGLGVIFLITIIIIISMYYQIITLKITNEILEKNNEVNQKAIYQYRILKHNLESQLMGVKTVANKKAKALLDNLIKEYNESFYIKHDINSMPLGINGLVLDKLYKYNEDKIEISITNKIKSKILKTVGPRSYNLFCEALGVTLDNALESAKESKDKLVYIEFRENKEVIQMKIMNTFHGNIDLDKLGTVNYTSKKKGHGLGLYSLFGRKNLTITTSIKNNLFVNKIEVKKLKRK